MKIKEFEALTLKDCLNQVRKELGPEAVILETRKCRKGGMIGIGARDAVRIIAATGITVNMDSADSGKTADRDPTRDRSASAVDQTRLLQSSIRRLQEPVMGSRNNTLLTGVLSEIPGSSPTLGVAEERLDRQKLARLEREVKELHEGIATMRQAALTAPLHQADTSPAPPSTAQTYPELLAQLREADVDEVLARDLLDAMPDLSAWSPQARRSLADAALRDRMIARLNAGGAIHFPEGVRKVVALVGPTGVGKTTTIAKLAAHFSLVEKLKVGLLTVDTYRIAAIEQLRTYSQIIDIPIQVVYNADEVQTALRAYDNCDLVLIDTAGRSQKNTMQVDELKTLLEACQGEAHLCLSASTRGRDLRDQIERFSTAGVQRLIFTKLDETTTYGTIYSIAAECDIPVSYLTTGQKVPEDIEHADSAKLVELALMAVPPAQAETIRLS